MLGVWRNCGEDRGITQIDVQIFQFGRPIRVELGLKAGANSPAGRRRVARSPEQTIPRVYILDGETACNINERCADSRKEKI